MLKQLGINELQPGMMVTQVIEQNGPVKIRRVGMVKSDAMIKGLREMGVNKVEVDFSQSLTVENDNKAEEHDVEVQYQKSVNPAEIKSTPTQRLIDNERQVEQVDRQLSQQFHNSLFMPAIEEMPSLFQLYAKPLSFLASFAVLGFCLGFLAMQTPTLISMWQNSNDQTVDTAQSTVSETNEANSLSEGMQISKNGEIALGETAGARELTATPLSQGNTEQQAQSTDKTEQQNVILPDASLTDETASAEPPEQLAYVNGVPLQSGERVLGYQAEDDFDLNSGTEENQGALSRPSNSLLSDAERIERETGGRVINSPNEPSSAGTFSDLLRRVNEAAAEVEESEPQQYNENSLVEDVASSNNASPSEGLANAPTRYQRLDELPLNIQNVLPTMSFSAHMYASAPEDRWVRVNSLRREENEFITDGLRIVEIQADKVILEYRGERFSMNALSDW